jgi:dienelactone hydrolase
VKLLRLLLVLGACLAQAAGAATLRDESVMVPKGHGLFHVELETHIYAPPGDGPFPLVVINHGKEFGDPHFQQSADYYGQALEFVRRGYAVIVPMREGFAKSGGTYRSDSCNDEDDGLTGAADVLAAIDYAKHLPYVDPTRIVVIGQSHGGLATMALGSLNPPGVVALINFAGGLHFLNCPGSERSLVEAFGAYGKTARMPSLWMYGDNDSLFPPPLVKRMLTAYEDAGGHAQFIDYGTFGSDGHIMFSQYNGMPIWLPAVSRFLTSLGLPFEVRYDLRAHTDGPDIEDVDAVPYLKPAGREGYRRFLWYAPPRAFALSPDGHWAYRFGENAGQQALAECARIGGAHCELYAVGQELVRH